MKLWISAVLVLLTCQTARADTHVYVVAIGNNAPPTLEAGEQPLQPLRYADDDAADFFTFTRDLARRSFLLAVLDAPSQRRFPKLASVALPPSLLELRRVVTRLREQFDSDRRDGHDSVLLFFFSGHGTRGGKLPPALALVDEPLTQTVLYDEVLSLLPGRYVHLLIDACHAEAIVRPRDASAHAVDVTEADVQTYAARETLARFPNVGAALATSSGAQAHEWDVYERGVFSHELMSALRGAADVNADGTIEYSELSAFLGAANSNVAEPQARLSVIVHPPSSNARAALLDIKPLPNTFRLVGQCASLREIYIEDDRGNRLVDLHAEPNYRVQLVLPASEPLYMHHASGEVALLAAKGMRIRVEDLRFKQPALKARGALHSALERGLFSTAYGPRYYRGYVDQSGELLPVAVIDAAASSDELSDPNQRAFASDDLRAQSPRGGAVFLATSGVFVAAAAVLGVLANRALARAADAEYERPRSQERSRAVLFETSTLIAAGLALATGVAGTWLFVRAPEASPATADLKSAANQESP